MGERQRRHDVANADLVREHRGADEEERRWQEQEYSYERRDGQAAKQQDQAGQGQENRSRRLLQKISECEVADEAMLQFARQVCVIVRPMIGVDKLGAVNVEQRVFGEEVKGLDHN